MRLRRLAILPVGLCAAGLLWLSLTNLALAADPAAAAPAATAPVIRVAALDNRKRSFFSGGMIY